VPNRDEHRDIGRNQRDLVIALVLTAGYCMVELVGGILTNSLALLSDAGHMFADVAALGLSVFAIRLAQMPPTAKRTFGFHRVEILAALVNALVLWAIVGAIAVEAFQRLREPPPINGTAMMLIAVVGLAVNLISLSVLRHSQRESLNVRAAFVHVLGDALGSVGVIVAAILIWAVHWRLADPLVSVGIGVLILYSWWEIIRDAVDILMQSTPRGMRLEDLEQCLLSIDGVRQIHDLHVWTLTSGKFQLSVHLVVSDGCDPRPVIDAAQTQLSERFAIGHTTVQVDSEVECAEEFRAH